eukprot:14495543-Ditylum_brightwellii.AAC.1
MIVELINFITLWLNSFPVKRGAHNTLSPRQIVWGHTLDETRHCKLPYGAYAHVINEAEPINDVDNMRTVGAICIGPVGNVQGGYKF